MNWTLTPDRVGRLGAEAAPDGVHFALAAPNAQAVELCLFDAAGLNELARLPMPDPVDGVWAGFLAHAQPGLVYGWRVHGPWAPQQGHRFNPAKLLLDPCAREVVGSYGGQDIHLGHVPGHPERPDPRDNAALALKARVVDVPGTAPLDRVAGVQVDPARRVIYEVHVKGFTALHPQVPAHQRGTYAGMAHPAVLAHLRQLGVTTLCLMPVAHRADEQRLQALGLANYWGYSPIAWNAPEARYWSGAPGTSPVSEFKAMVQALHQAGLEVILDVVYNHTGELDELGPTLSLRGIDNATYYHLDAHAPQVYLNWTGCGNCVNLNHPLVLRTVMDSLRGWVEDYDVDGFRFDLAPVLARGGPATHHRYDAHAPFLLAVAQDPVLCRKLMVAEPWDIGPGGYQMGAFPAGWLEWNDRFRDTQRAFWLRGHEHLGALAQRLAGSTEAFAPGQRACHASVNFVTAHDGFTLNDLVSYTHKHNEANGEHNRDGHGHNLSVNHGVEGPSTDPHVLALRARDRRALLAVTVLALGTPMLFSGDEMGHSQRGNNNAYCQDNDTTWLHWDGHDAEMVRFVARLTALRQSRSALQSRSWWATPSGGPRPAGLTLAHWSRPDGQPLTHEDWNHGQHRALRLRLCPAARARDALWPSPAAHAECLLCINAGAQALVFELPAGEWHLHLDTTQAQGGVAQALRQRVTVAPGGLCVLSSEPMA